MTDHSQNPDTDLPQFPVHVVPTEQIRSQHLRTLLENFRADEADPLIFGEDGRPEAAVIPFSAFVRLMRHDHAAHVTTEDAFQAELSDRLENSDAARAAGQRLGRPTGVRLTDIEATPEPIAVRRSPTRSPSFEPTPADDHSPRLG